MFVSAATSVFRRLAIAHFAIFAHVPRRLGSLDPLGHLPHRSALVAGPVPVSPIVVGRRHCLDILSRAGPSSTRRIVVVVFVAADDVA
jgi:hypothetical protein